MKKQKQRRAVGAAFTLMSCSFVLLFSKIHLCQNELKTERNYLLGLDYAPENECHTPNDACTSVPVTFGDRDLGNYIISGTLHVTLR